MESKANRKRKLCEEVEARGFGKITVENIGKKVDPGGDNVPKLSNPKGQMEKHIKVGRGSPVIGKRKANNSNNCKSKGSKAKNDIPPCQDVDNPSLDSLKQAEDVDEEVIEVSSDDDESGEIIKISSDDDESAEAIKVSRDDDKTGETTECNKETADSKEWATKELVKSLEMQISGMSFDLECPVCLNVCQPPIYSCVAQHPVCSRCRPDLKQCAVCRQPYDQRLIRHRYAERDYEKLEEVRSQLTLQGPRI